MLWITDESELNLKSGLSLVYFYAHRDPYHFDVFNHLENVEEEFPNIQFYAVDADSFPSLIKKHRIPSLPYVRVFRDEGYIAKSLVKLDDIFNTSVLRDIDTKYQQGVFNDRVRSTNRQRRHIADNDEENGATTTPAGSEDLSQDLG